MKSFLKSLITAAVLGLAVAPVLSLAQPPAGGGNGGGQARGRGGMNPEQRVAAIDEAVKLTAEQKPKVTAILTKASADVQALSQEERREKGRAINEAANKEIRALLTAEQQAKFDAMPAPGRGGRQGGNGGNGGKKE